VIPEALDGKRIFITGGTGFVGTALIERLLRGAPGCELVLLVRPGRKRTVEQRAQREIFKNDCFDRLRDELGGKAPFDEMVAQRVSVVAGDVGTDGLGLDDAGRATFATCDTIIHSAATVSFDAALDLAIEVNLLGPTRIAQTCHTLGVTPHLVAVSTCYVAGNRRGNAPEAPVDESPFWLGDLDWRAEVTAARRLRADADAESRTTPMLERFRAEAHAELGAAGTPLLAAKTESRRIAWVKGRMVEAGRARAFSLGWPDAYAYTKALAEQALAQNRGDVPVSVVRPSIIESAWAEPRPGWIRGFRMAEPIIISYARGLLKEFPGVPEGTVDVIPVDLVVAAICAVAAKGPEPELGHPSIYQVASGSANPLKYQRLVDLVQGWFSDHPLYDSDGQPILVPEWSFPGRGRVQAQLERSKFVLDKAETVLSALPLRGRSAELAGKVEESKELVDRASIYVELYGAYTECEAIYGVDRLLGLAADGSDADREQFAFDPRIIDWDRYATEIHLPSIIEHARVNTTGTKRSSGARFDRLRAQVLSPERHFAAFDLEHTILSSNVVTSYAWLATRRLPRDEKLRFAAQLVAEAPTLLKLDRRDRSDFLRSFYRRYEDAPARQLAEDSVEHFNQLLMAKAYPAALRRVREHRKLGHRTVLITGALDFVVEPLAPLFDDIVCTRMSTVVDDDGITRYTGQMTDVPPTGESRAQALLDYAAANDFDVAQAIAYADATSDLSMLETVGFPVAVNPEARLAALARKRGWLVEHWDRSSGAAAPILPLATRKGTHGERLLTRVATSFAEPLVASSNRKGRPSTKRKARR
jgi:HAD superfamily phosphoserine phosphatase-like hydrolase